MTILWRVSVNIRDRVGRLLDVDFPQPLSSQRRAPGVPTVPKAIRQCANYC